MKKIKHKKIIAVSVISLVAVATAGIGYASWVISQTNEAKIDQIQVTADNVVDNRITIKDAAVGGYAGGSNENDTTLNFGPVADSEGSITSAEATEDLTFAIHFTVEIPENSTFNGSIVAEAEIKDETGSASSWDSNYIFNPLASSKVTLVNIASGTATAVPETTGVKVTLKESTTYTFEAVFTFGWGAYFGNKNPAEGEESYITGEGDRTLDKAIEALETIYGYNNDKIAITLSTEATN